MTRIFLAFTLLTICPMFSFGQNNALKKDTTIFTVVDKYPILIANGRHYELDKIDEFIKSKIQFPDDPDDCQGKVYISIVVEKDGTLGKKEYISRLCDKFDENSMKIVDLMVKWEPGIKYGEPVRTKLTLHVTWKLE